MWLTDDQIKRLAYNIGMEWECIGTYLQFPHSDIKKIKRDHPCDTDGAIKYMLKTWNGRPCTKRNQMDALAEALMQSGRADLCDMVLCWKREKDKRDDPWEPLSEEDAWVF